MVRYIAKITLKLMVAIVVSSPAFGTTFYLVRHGESEGNTKKIMQGWLNYPLTDRGVAQANQVAARLCATKNSFAPTVFSSDLTRASSTAEIIAAACDSKLPLEKFSGLREFNFGVVQGLTQDDVKKRFPNEFARLDTLSPEKKWTTQIFEGAETSEQVAARSLQSLRTIAGKYPNQSVIVVTHGGVIRSLFHLAQGKDKKISVHNTAVAKFHLKGDDLKFVTMVSG